MKNHPLVSVVIPTYNQEQFLADAIDSVIAQTYKHCEIIVIDDGSTDGTHTLLKKYSEILVVEQENMGLSAARNAGIACVTGDYIALLDSDDLMQPDRIKTQLQQLQENPAIDVLYTAITVIDEKGDRLNTIRREVVPVDQFLPLEFFRNLVPSPSTILAKSKVFQKEPFNEAFRIGEDLEWIIRTAHRHTFHYLDAPLTLYRRHQKNISENLEELRKVELQILKQYGSDHILKCIDESSVADKHLLKGKILYIMQEYKQAIDHLFLTSDPLARFYSGNVKFEQKQYELALEDYKVSFAEDPTNPACYNNYALCCLKLGLEEEAGKAFALALELKPEYLDPQSKRFTRRELRKDLLPYRS